MSPRLRAKDTPLFSIFDVQSHLSTFQKLLNSWKKCEILTTKNVMISRTFSVNAITQFTLVTAAESSLLTRVHQILISGGPAHYPAYSGLLPRPGSHPHPPPSPFPPQLVYWPGPGCGYPSPPISPSNYFLPPTPGPASASLCLTPTSSLSSLSNGVTSPGPGHAPPSGHSSPPLPLQQNSLVSFY